MRCSRRASVEIYTDFGSERSAALAYDEIPEAVVVPMDEGRHGETRDVDGRSACLNKLLSSEVEATKRGAG